LLVVFDLIFIIIVQQGFNNIKLNILQLKLFVLLRYNLYAEHLHQHYIINSHYVALCGKAITYNCTSS